MVNLVQMRALGIGASLRIAAAHPARYPAGGGRAPGAAAPPWPQAPRPAALTVFVLDKIL